MQFLGPTLHILNIQPKTFFLNYIFIFIQFRFLRSFSLTFISILNCLRSRDEPQEDINQYRVQEGPSKR